MPRGAQQGIVAKFRIRQDRGDPKAGGANLAEQRERVAPLFLELNGRGNPAACPRLRRHPRLGQIQLGAEEPRLRPRPERCGGRHLAIRNLAEGTTVLARHPHRSVALLRKTRPVENQYAFARGNHPPQLPPQPLGRPRRRRDEVLEGLIAARIADAREHRAHRLPGTVTQQAEQVAPKRAPLRDVPKRRLERLQPRQQPIDPRRRIRRQHVRQRTEMRCPVQCPQFRSRGIWP